MRFRQWSSLEEALCRILHMNSTRAFTSQIEFSIIEFLPKETHPIKLLILLAIIFLASFHTAWMIVLAILSK